MQADVEGSQFGLKGRKTQHPTDFKGSYKSNTLPNNVATRDLQVSLNLVNKLEHVKFGSSHIHWCKHADNAVINFQPLQNATNAKLSFH